MAISVLETYASIEARAKINCSIANPLAGGIDKDDPKAMRD
jgi:hypothetical protein